MGDEFSLEDVLIIIRRRILFFIIPILILTPIGIIIVMLLPPQYTANGTILVESRQIPESMASSTIIADAQERIQTTRARIMTRNRLLEIAAEQRLFPREQRLTETQRVDRMRKSLKITPITTEVRRSGRRQEAAIAFTVGYEHTSPQKAFETANEFITLFLEEDARIRLEQAENTTEFFERETESKEQELADLEAQIAAFKLENADALPENLNLHQSMLERANREIAALDNQIGNTEEELDFLETQMQSIVAGSAEDTGPGAELEQLRAELTRLKARYTDANPSVRAVQAEIAAVERRMQPSEKIQTLTDDLDAARAELSALAGADIPDQAAINDKRKVVKDLTNQLSEQFAQEAATASGRLLAAQIQNRMSRMRNRIEFLTEQQQGKGRQRADLESRISRTPENERRLASLTRDYENLRASYQDRLASRETATLAENLENNQKGEKLRILEAAVKPETPSSPDRPKLSLMALFFAICAGGASAFIAEMFLATVRGRHHLTSMMGDHPIAVIPMFASEEEKNKGFKLPFAGKKPPQYPPIRSQTAVATPQADPVGEPEKAPA